MDRVCPPLYVVKECLFIRERRKWKYSITEDGYGIAYIDTYKVFFEVNEYGEILIETIHL